MLTCRDRESYTASSKYSAALDGRLSSKLSAALRGTGFAHVEVAQARRMVETASRLMMVLTGPLQLVVIFGGS